MTQMSSPPFSRKFGFGRSDPLKLRKRQGRLIKTTAGSVTPAVVLRPIPGYSRQKSGISSRIAARISNLPKIISIARNHFARSDRV